MLKKLVPFLAITAAAVHALAQPPTRFDGKTWWAHVEALANDRMEGRETGRPGLRQAEGYIVDQLKQAGLQPAGEHGSYEQTVRFESRQILEADSSATLLREGRSEPVRLGDEAIFSTRVDLAPEVEAPLAFVGYGLRVPEKGYDDLGGLDLRGKVAVLFSGSPETIPGPLAAHYQTSAERWKAFREAVVIPTPRPWTCPGRASPSTARTPAWSSATPSSTRPRARSWR